jgi:hypothetical protein
MRLDLLLTAGILALPLLTRGSSISGALVKGEINNPLCPADIRFQLPTSGNPGPGSQRSPHFDTGTCSMSFGSVTVSGQADGFADAFPFENPFGEEVQAAAEASGLTAPQGPRQTQSLRSISTHSRLHRRYHGDRGRQLRSERPGRA